MNPNQGHICTTQPGSDSCWSGLSHFHLLCDRSLQGCDFFISTDVQQVCFISLIPRVRLAISLIPHCWVLVCRHGDDYIEALNTEAPSRATRASENCSRRPDNEESCVFFFPFVFNH